MYTRFFLASRFTNGFAYGRIPAIITIIQVSNPNPIPDKSISTTAHPYNYIPSPDTPIPTWLITNPNRPIPTWLITISNNSILIPSNTIILSYILSNPNPKLFHPDQLFQPDKELHLPQLHPPPDLHLLLPSHLKSTNVNSVLILLTRKMTGVTTVICTLVLLSNVAFVPKHFIVKKMGQSTLNKCISNSTEPCVQWISAISVATISV